MAESNVLWGSGDDEILRHYKAQLKEKLRRITERALEENEVSRVTLRSWHILLSRGLLLLVLHRIYWLLRWTVLFASYKLVVSSINFVT